jgi:hypothetical protein
LNILCEKVKLTQHAEETRKGNEKLNETVKMQPLSVYQGCTQKNLLSPQTMKRLRDDLDLLKPFKDSEQMMTPRMVQAMVQNYNGCGFKKDDDRYFRKHRIRPESILAIATSRKTILALLRAQYSGGLIATYLLREDKNIKKHYRNSDPEKAFQSIKRAINRLRYRLPTPLRLERKFTPQFIL